MVSVSCDVFQSLNDSGSPSKHDKRCCSAERNNSVSDALEARCTVAEVQPRRQPISHSPKYGFSRFESNRGVVLLLDAEGGSEPGSGPEDIGPSVICRAGSEDAECSMNAGRVGPLLRLK